MKKTVITLMLILSAVYAKSAFPCRPAPYYLQFQCTFKNDTAIQNSGLTSYQRDIVYIYQDERSNKPSSEYFHALTSVCKENLDSIEKIFNESLSQIKEMNKDYLTFDRFMGGDTTIQPYSVELEKELDRQFHSYLTCGYRTYKRHLDWYITTDTTRDYCGLATFKFACPTPVLSPTKFLIFLLTNIRRETLPYMIPIALSVIAMILFILYLIIKGDFIQFFKPNTFNKVSLFSILFLIIWMLFFGMLLETFILMVFFFYFIGSLLMYIFKS